MPHTAHIICAALLRVEVYDAGDGPDGRRQNEEKMLLSAVKNTGKDVATKLNPNLGKPSEDTTTATKRPAFVLPAFIPMDWSVKWNSFRVPDDFEMSFPLELLPIPGTAIRVATVLAMVRHVSADQWARGLSNNDLSATLFAKSTISAGDFEGIATTHEIKTGHKVPMVHMKFVDFFGLVGGKAVPVGKTLERDIPVTEAIRNFLKGTPAEGMEVVWVDPTQPEPDLGKGVPKAKKAGKSGKVSKPPTHSGQKYADAIFKECEMLGVVPRVYGSTIQVAYAGTMYEGADRGGDEKATLLLGSVIEDFTSTHELIGSKIHTVQVASYNPDNGKHLVARWPPDPKKTKATLIAAGGAPTLPPLAANVGLPGAAQMDESILLVPVGPCTDPAVLVEIARSVFVEKTRQKLKHTLETSAPWPDPDDDDAEDGKLLSLRAGDNVKFGVVAAPGPTMPRALIAVVAGADAGATAQLLRGQGIKAELANRVALAIASAPTSSRWRVDELKVASSGEEGAKLTITLVNFTVVVSDLTEIATRRSVADYKKTANDLLVAAPSQTNAQVQAMYEAQFKALSDSGMSASDQAEGYAALSSSYQTAMKGR